MSARNSAAPNESGTCRPATSVGSISLDNPPRFFFPDELLENKNSTAELNRLCGYCQHICQESQVLNDSAWHRASTLPDKELPGRQINSYMSDDYPPERRIGGPPPWDEGYFPESFLFHPSVECLLLSALSGCHLCTLFCYNTYEYMSKRQWMFGKGSPWQKIKGFLGNTPFRVAITWECDFSYEQIYYRLVLQDDRLRADKAREFCRVSLDDTQRSKECNNASVAADALASTTTESDTILGLANHWLRECCSNHTACCRSSDLQKFLPTRLLDVGPPDGSQNPHLHICDPEVEEMEYVTLSHCWGAKDIYRLTMSTMDELQRGIDPAKLPRNFREAITVCRKLGRRYIWIDSLCIIQDSPSDWRKESALMGSVYSNSDCTVAALGAKDSSEGLFRTRNPRCEHPCVLPVKLHLSAVADSPHSRHGNRKVPRPLYDRAWVFQERLLSPRVLRFGHTKISWECQEALASEDYPTQQSEPQWVVFRDSDEDNDIKVQKALASLRPLLSLDNQESYTIFFESWRQLLKAYTSMKLTFPKDRLPAFFGITKVQMDRTGFSSYEGLWMESFLPMLLWYSKAFGGFRISETFEQQGKKLLCTSTMLTNSLSWASIEGSIDYYRDWPFWEADTSSVSNNTQSNTSATDLETIHERRYTVEVDNFKAGTMKKFDGTRSRASKIAGVSRYCTRVVELIWSNSSPKSPSVVILEGPIYRFRTERLRSPESKWSNPFWGNNRDINHPDQMNSGWFFPDLRWNADCPPGTTIDVTCLSVIEWGQAQPEELKHGESYTSPGVHNAGIVLAKLNDLDEEGRKGYAAYVRIGFFEFGREMGMVDGFRARAEIDQVTII